MERFTAKEAREVQKSSDRVKAREQDFEKEMVKIYLEIKKVAEQGENVLVFSNLSKQQVMQLNKDGYNISTHYNEDREVDDIAVRW